MQHDHIPEPLQAADQVALERLAIPLGARRACLALVDARWVLQQVIDDAQDRVADGDGRPLLPRVPPTAGTAPGGRIPWSGRPPGPPRRGRRAARDCPSGSCRCAAGRHSGSCPGTFPPRTRGGPPSEPLHVRADLGHQHLGRPLPDARDGVQPRHGRGEGLGPRGDLGADLRDALIQEVEVVQLLCHQEALVRSEPTDQGLLQLGDLLAGAALRPVRRVALARSPRRSAPAAWRGLTCP